MRTFIFFVAWLCFLPVVNGGIIFRDPLAVHVDGLDTLEGNWSLGGYNLTNGGESTFNHIHISSGETYDTIIEADNKELSADRTLTIDLSNADRTLKVYGNAEIRDWFGQGVKPTDGPTFTSLTFDLATGYDYKFLDRAGSLALQSLTSAQGCILEQFTEDGNSTDHITHNMFVKGTVDSLTDYELLQIGYIAGDGFYRIRAVKGGTGSAMPLVLWTESNTNQLKLGTGGEVYLAGVYDDDIGTERDLLIKADGQLGYDSSSRRFKENIVDLPDSISERIYKLQPRQYNKTCSTKQQFGLIAEEVNDVFPELISFKRSEIMGPCRDHEGKEYEGVVGYELTDIPETVNYRRLIVPLIQEIKKLKARVDELEK